VAEGEFIAPVRFAAFHLRSSETPQPTDETDDGALLFLDEIARSEAAA
jgi:hypothetical protein